MFRRLTKIHSRSLLLTRNPRRRYRQRQGEPKQRTNCSSLESVNIKDDSKQSTEIWPQVRYPWKLPKLPGRCQQLLGGMIRREPLKTSLLRQSMGEMGDAAKQCVGAGKQWAEPGKQDDTSIILLSETQWKAPQFKNSCTITISAPTSRKTWSIAGAIAGHRAWALQTMTRPSPTWSH